MSNINSVIYCPKCGEANHGLVHFCFSCGTRLVNFSADNTSTVNAMPAHSYGTAQPSRDAMYAPTVEKRSTFEQTVHNTASQTVYGGVEGAKKSSLASRTTVSVQHGVKGYFPKTRACALILLAISFLMLLAAFLPMVKVDTAYNDTSSFSTSFSPTEILSIAMDSVGATTEEDYLEEYQNYTSLRIKVQNINFDANLQRSQKNTLKDYAKSALKMHMMSGEGSPKANLVVAGIVTLVYIFAAVATFVYAFVLAAFYNSLNAPNVDGLLKLVKSLVAIVLVLMPVYMMLMLQTAHFSHGFGIMNFADSGAGLAWYGIIMLIVVIAAVAFMCFKSFSHIFKKESASKDYALISRVAALLCLVLAVLAVFLPFASVQLATMKNGEVLTESFSVSVNNFYELSYSDASYYTSMTNMYSKSDLLLLIDNIVNGRVSYDSMGADMFNKIAFRYNIGIEYLYTIIGIFALITAFVLVLFVMAVMRLVLSKRMIRHKKALMAFSLMSTSIHLALSILISVVCNVNMNSDIAHYVLISVGAGPILSVILTLVAVVLLSIRSKSETLCEHDNPDVSYAPYVV